MPNCLILKILYRKNVLHLITNKKMRLESLSLQRFISNRSPVTDSKFPASRREGGGYPLYGDRYISLDQLYEVQIGLYELWGYARANQKYEKLIEEREEIFELLYDRAVPSLTDFNPAEGRVFVARANADWVALKIIDYKEAYDFKIRKEKRKYEMFDAAMEVLDDQEQETIRIIYQGIKDSSSLSSEEFEAVLTGAEEKLIQFLEAIRQKECDRIIRADREALRAEIHSQPVVSRRDVIRISI